MREAVGGAGVSLWLPSRLLLSLVRLSSFMVMLNHSYILARHVGYVNTILMICYNAAMNHVGIYATDKYTAYMYPRKIIISTKRQSFRIAYDNYYSDFWLDKLKLAILKGQIKDISDLGEYNQGVLKWYDCKEPDVSRMR